MLAGHDLARAALNEITPANTVGEPAGYSVEPDGVVSLRFENRLPGYPGWYWTVSLARVPDAAPTVLEVELLPGDAALLAPDWTPWDVRLADYQAAQLALAEAAGEDVEGFADDADDLDDDDEDDDEDSADELDADEADDDEVDDESDDDVTPVLHAGDVDGVDIDQLDDTVDDDESDDDESDDDDDLGDEDDDDDEDESDDDLGDEDDDESDDELEDDPRA
nr:DUF3027 domain-containing protein [Microbacterium lemovicicum]